LVERLIDSETMKHGLVTNLLLEELTMGRRATRFVELKEEDRVWLEQQWKHDPSHATRSRAHAILLNSQHYCMAQISRILNVSYDTVENWLTRWDDHGRDGLADGLRSGRTPKLDNQDRNVLREIVEQHPQEPSVMLKQLHERTNKTVSRGTLRRTLRKLGYRWKRLRRSLRKRRDPVAFRNAAEELKELSAMPDVKLVYFDEANFSISGVVSYAWQRMGERAEIPISGGHRNSIQVLGFLSKGGKVRSYVQRSTVKGSSVVAVINDFMRSLTGTTVLVLDNASPHTCREVSQQIEQWAKRGLILYNLPAYSPELNSIEHIWRKLKHQLIPATAWETIDRLAPSLLESLKQMGTVRQLEPLLAV
jgi:transposase